MESTSHTTVVSKLNGYYLPKRKRTFERQRFYDVVQGSKTVEEFERELHAAAKYCEFFDKTEHLCDQFVRGLNDELKHRLCLADELTLEKAVATAKLSERIKYELQTSRVADKSADEVSRGTSNHNSRS